MYWNILRYTILEVCQSRLKREVWNRNVFLHLKMGSRFHWTTVPIESAEICMFWPWQYLHVSSVTLSIHFLYPNLWCHSPELLLLFYCSTLLFQFFLFPTWVGKMCVLVGPINLHFHGACSHSPSIPGLNPKTFICSNFLSSVLTYIDGAVLEVMIDTVYFRE